MPVIQDKELERSETYTSRRYRIEMVGTVGGLEPHARSWDNLAAQAPARVHSISHAWVASFFEHLIDPDTDYRCLLVFDGDDLVGVLPFVLSKKYFSILTKSDVCPPTSDQTFASDLVCRCEDAPEIIDAILDALDHFLPGAWELVFHHVSDRSQVVRRFASRRRPTLSHVRPEGCGNLVSTSGSFESYLGSLRPHFAANLRRSIRKVERLPGYRVDYLAGRDADPRYLGEFLRLEASGWKGRQGTAILADAREMAFYEAFTRRLHARGWLEWHLLSVGGHAVAAHLAIRCGRVVYLWKIAYDEDYKMYAPGNVLMIRTIERAFESPDTEEINCLTDSPWNRDWNMEHRLYFKVTVWPRRLIPFLAGYCRARSKDALRLLPGARAAYCRLRHPAAGNATPRDARTPRNPSPD